MLLGAGRAEQRVSSDSKTEAFLDINLTTLLSDYVPCIEEIGLQPSGPPLSENPTPEDISSRIEAILEHQRVGRETLDTKQLLPSKKFDYNLDASDCEDDWCNDNSIVLHTRLTAVHIWVVLCWRQLYLREDSSYIEKTCLMSR